MNYTLDDLREDSLRCLRSELGKLFQRQSKTIKFDRITLNNLHYQLALTLVQIINSDTEPQLQKELNTLVDYQKQLQFYQNVLRHEQQAAEEEIKRARLDTSQLRKSFELLENELMELQLRQKKRTELLKSKTDAHYAELQAKSAVSGRGRMMLSSTRDSLANLKRNYSDLVNKQVFEMRDIQKKLTSYVKTSMSRIQNDALSNVNYNQQKQRTNDAKATLNKARKQYTEAITVINRLFEQNLPLNSTSDLRTDDLLRFVRDRYNTRVQSEIDNVKKELLSILPDLQFTGMSIYDAITELIKRRIAEKEEYCKKILLRSAKREKKLKEKLAETLSELKQLRSRSFADSSRIITEINTLKNNYNNSQMTLDQKVMMLTERIKSPSSSSSFSFSPTRGSP